MIYTQAIIYSLITFIIAILSIILSYKKYIDKNRSLSYLFYFLGFLMFFISALIQVLFSIGIEYYVLSLLYIVLVAELVLLYSLGSAQYLEKKYLKIYYIYAIISSIILITASIYYYPYNIAVNGIPGNFPLQLVNYSMIVTIPSTTLILVMASISLLKKYNRVKMISILIGIIVLSFGGMLSGTGFPQALYLSEIIGMSLLLYGI